MRPFVPKSWKNGLVRSKNLPSVKMTSRVPDGLGKYRTEGLFTFEPDVASPAVAIPRDDSIAIAAVITTLMIL